jgi:putative aminopeptidase FrvX
MTIDQKLVDRAIEHALSLCGIASPTGFTKEAEAYVEAALSAAGFSPSKSAKGAVLCGLGGSGRPLILAAHIDTLGAIVRSLKDNGRLRYSKIGGYPDLNLVTETCVIHTREGKSFTGTFQPVEASAHVNVKLGKAEPSDENLEILVDEVAKKKDELLALGISPGDIVSIDARPVLTPSGFLKSRHLDDKASAGVLLALAEGLRAGTFRASREIWLLFTTYEEVGHGGAVLPPGAADMISVDMGAVGEDLGCDEYKVSICAKDSNGPCDWDLTTALVQAAKRAGCAFAVDVYPAYGADADVALKAGHDLRHAIVGPGVYASHGYERSHREALANTLALLAEFVAG